MLMFVIGLSSVGKKLHLNVLKMVLNAEAFTITVTAMIVSRMEITDTDDEESDEVFDSSLTQFSEILEAFHRVRRRLRWFRLKSTNFFKLHIIEI
jgi:hypothetical protein